MRQNTGVFAYRMGAIFYMLWGLLHILAALGVAQVGAGQATGVAQSKIYQDAWNLFYLAVFVIVIAAVFNWKNSWLGYWLNLVTISVIDTGFIVLIFLPRYNTDLTGPILWILGAIFSSIGIRTAPRTR